MTILGANLERHVNLYMWDSAASVTLDESLRKLKMTQSFSQTRVQTPGPVRSLESRRFHDSST